MMGGSSPTRLFCSRLRNIKSLVCNMVDSPVLILCYHRVASRVSDLNSVIVSPDNFRAHIDYLKQNFTIVRFEEKWEHHGQPAVAITFDDGYADNLTVALPILEEAGVPATFFISTEHIGTGNEFWWDALERMVAGNGTHPPKFTLSDPRYGRTWPTSSFAERTILFQELHPLFMEGTHAERAGWLEQVRAWSGGSCRGSDANRLLTADELKRLANRPGVTIGAHSVTHPLLSALTEDEQRREIIESGRQLEKLTGKEIKVFAYPFGKKADFTDTSALVCREAGYVKAAAAYPGEAHRWTDPFRIPRHFVYNWNSDRFAYKLKRLWV